MKSPLSSSPVKKEPMGESVRQTTPSFHLGHNQERLERFRNLAAPHVESFDYMLTKGLEAGIQDVEPMEILIADPKQQLRDASSPDNTNVNNHLSDAPLLKCWFEGIRVHKPIRKYDGRPLTPRESRERKLMYAGMMRANFCYQIIERRNGLQVPGTVTKIPREFGELPIMVMSKACHLYGSTSSELVQKREEDTEFGGYFIVNGIERCVRLLQVPRRNFPTAIQRSNYKNRGPTYTDLGVAIRCSRHNGDQSSITNTVHYLTTGACTLKFVARKQEFLLPIVVLIRALSGMMPADNGPDAAAGGTSMGITDEELYKRIVQGDNQNTFLVARAGLLLQDTRARYSGLNTPQECLAYIGARFRRVSLRAESTSDIEIAHYVIRRFILIHVPDYRDKLECLFLMIRKVYALASGDCGVDNADSLQTQEILLPGHLICAMVKEKFEETLQEIRLGLSIAMRRDYADVLKRHKSTDYYAKLVDRHSKKSSGGIGKRVATFLSTGNIVSSSGLDLMQVSGYTIVAERLNFLRYCAHFRSVHRGQFFMEMKTTAVRKLLPDQWGFLCPVHTPDGGPCGLLSHLSLKCSVRSKNDKAKDPHAPPLADILYSLGVSRTGMGSHGGQAVSSHMHLPVSIDGRNIGGASIMDCRRIASILREMKVQDKPQVPPTMEVALIPPGKKGSPFPGLFIFTLAARLTRPVLQRATGKTEYIGPLEQGFMDIACLDEDIREGITTHQELDPTNMLSLIANLTPFSDQNQSPRNMYQCQMGKQTMGTPAHSLPFRPDNKLYRIQTPQAPLVQTSIHGEYKMDEYPNGTNAIIAVMSYTGFDMEDAMILNKASLERGFKHAHVLKNVSVSLEDKAKTMGSRDLRFSNEGRDRKSHMNLDEKLDEDGFVRTGQKVEYGDPLVAVYDPVQGETSVEVYKEREPAIVQSVTRVGGDTNNKLDEKVSIVLRTPRTPVIGDKFSSRHGQKGVLSITWPQSDMPFTESGITPDILFNPHGFPSRMTIGMLVEMMAAKSGSLHGFFQNGTPFAFHETAEQNSIDYFGEQLQAAGFNYYGSEPLYSGVSGCVMHADLYIGVVYYQRLRHMVSDKYQVRATGPTNSLTRQPIKGRKKGGGIRLGEMERDSLLSHGAAFLLQDRLLNCSDRHIAYACSRCGDLLMPTTERVVLQSIGSSLDESQKQPKLRLYCRSPECRAVHISETSTDEAVEPIVLPYVYRYLCNELAGMNIGMKLDIQ